MEFEWDPVKANANYRKHGVLLSDDVSVLEDESALTVRDPHFEEEERWITLGVDSLGRLLVVIYEWRGASIRLISTRSATRHEWHEYYKDGGAKYGPRSKGKR